MSVDINRKIKKIILTNFQNHKKSSIDLTNGLNLLVGSSDSGKTAIARAIDFVLYNNSEGSEYVHIGEKFAEVQIEFEDGSIIKRTKGGRINKVEYKYSSDDEFTLRAAFGDYYPDDVINFLKTPSKSKLLGSMSYSNQLNKNFLIDLSFTQIPGVISDLVGVSDLEDAAVVLSTKVRNYDVEIKSCERNIAQIQKKLDEDYIGLDDKVETIKKIKEIFSDIDEMKDSKLSLEKYYTKYQSLNIRGNDARIDLNKAALIIETLKSRIEDLKNKNKDLNSKIDLLDSYNKKNNKIEIVDNELKIYKLLTDGRYKKILDGIEIHLKDLKEQQKIYEKLNSNLNQSENISNEITELDSKIQKLYADKDDIFKEIEENNLYCDKCKTIFGRKI